VEPGARHEPDRLAGASHFVEHLMFKGTRRRTARQIAEEIDALGGQMNAFTDKEQTCYYVRVLSAHLPQVVEVLADMLLDSTFEADAIEKERHVVLEEIKMYEDDPDDLVQDLFLETIWEGHALGRPVIGRASTVDGMRRADILEYLAREYTAPRVLIAAAGDVAHAAFVDLIRERFGGWAGAAPARDEGAPAQTDRVCYRARDVEQVHLCFGYPGLPIGSPQRYALSVLDNIAGGGMSSRLFQEVREKRGLVYSIGTFALMYREAGTFGVYAGTSPENVADVVRLSIDEMRRLCDTAAPAAEVRRAQEALKGSLMLSLEGTAPRMFFLARGELNYGRRVTPDEILAGIDAVTPDDVAALSRQLIAARHFAAAVVGPEDAESETRAALAALGVS
jgi:predicted Zn-dependent peptidase